MLDIVGLFLVILSIIANGIGTAIPYWLYYKRLVAKSGEIAHVYYGLWKVCIDANSLGGAQCTDIEYADLEIEFVSARAIEISAHIPMLVTIVIVAFKILTKGEGTKSFKIAALLAFITGVLSIVGAVVFVTAGFVKEINEAYNAKATLHAGFALCIVSGGLNFIASVLFTLHKDSSIQNKSPHMTRVMPLTTNHTHNDSWAWTVSNRQHVVTGNRTSEWQAQNHENVVAPAGAWPIQTTVVPQRTRNDNPPVPRVVLEEYAVSPVMTNRQMMDGRNREMIREEQYDSNIGSIKHREQPSYLYNF